MVTFLKNIKFYFLSIAVILIVCEIGFRIFLSFSFKTSFLSFNEITNYYYPELTKLSNYTYQKDKINLLVLGGSVLYDKPITLPNSNNQLVVVRFCDVEKQLNRQNDIFNVVNLAVPAHTTLDSRYKYENIAGSYFDYVLVYHGINDTRSNNIKYTEFDTLYRHIEFYDDLAVFVNQHQSQITVLPLFFDWFRHQAKKLCKVPNYIPREFLGFIYRNDVNKFDQYMKHGNEIKTALTFRKNLEDILVNSKKRNERLILSSYAYHYDPDYSWEKFINGELDYADSTFPIELYGYPENVIKGIKAHNEIIREIAQENSEVIFLDLERIISKDRNQFNDVCHLTKAGCDSLVSLLQKKIFENKYQ